MKIPTLSFILPYPTIYSFVRYHSYIFYLASAHYLLWAQVLSQKFFYTLLHSLCKYLLSLLFKLTFICLSLGKIRVVFSTTTIAIAFYFSINITPINSNSFSYIFFTHRNLQHLRNCIPLLFGYMFTHLQLLFLWTDNKNKDSNIIHSAENRGNCLSFLSEKNITYAAINPFL